MQEIVTGIVLATVKEPASNSGIILALQLFTTLILMTGTYIDAVESMKEGYREGIKSVQVCRKRYIYIYIYIYI